MRCRATPTCLAILLLLASCGAPPALAQSAPSRGVVELAHHDFLALTPDGRQLLDLTAADVTLKIDGRARDIRSLQFVRVAGEPLPRASGPSTPLAAPFGTNSLDGAGRTVVLIFETDSIRPNVIQQAIAAAETFVSELSPRDWIGVVTMPYGGLLVEPTREHARVLKALATITGQGRQNVTDSDKACRTRDTLVALAAHFTAIAPLKGPKTIVFVSSGMLGPRRDAPMNGPPGPCEIKPQHFDDVGRAAALARANVYAVRPDDLVIDSAQNAFADPTASRFRSTDDEMAGIESLAGVTDGVLLRLTSTDRSAFGRIARESAGYYLVGFEPRNGERNGLARRVEVTVTRPEARVKMRPTVVLAKPVGTRSAQTPQDMLRDGKSYRDLPLRTLAYVSPNPGDSQLRVLAVVEPLDRAVALASAAFGLIDARGKLVAQWTANGPELTSNPVMSAGLATPGRYRLRTAAIDAAGRRGAADYDLSAELVSTGGMTMSGLVLGVSFERNFVAKLQFVQEPTAAGYFEIFGAPASGTLAVALEIATSEDGPALIRVPAAVAATSDPDRRRAAGVVPVGSLQPGDYVVRAVVSLDARPIGRLTRVLRKAAP